MRMAHTTHIDIDRDASIGVTFVTIRRGDAHTGRMWVRDDMSLDVQCDTMIADAWRDTFGDSMSDDDRAYVRGAIAFQRRPGAL